MHHPTDRITHTPLLHQSWGTGWNDSFNEHKCGVVESFQFHPELVLNFLRDSEFYSKF